jgi:hypothetical protein
MAHGPGGKIETLHRTLQIENPVFVIPGRAKREPGIHFSQRSSGAMDSGPACCARIPE